MLCKYLLLAALPAVVTNNKEASYVPPPPGLPFLLLWRDASVWPGGSLDQHQHLLGPLVSDSGILPESFILCSSHQLPTIHSRGIYQVYGPNGRPWFNPTFWQSTGSAVVQLYGLVNDGWHVGPVEGVGIYLWQHICFDINTKSDTIKATFNGKLGGKGVQITGLKKNQAKGPKGSLVLGTWV